MEKLRIGVLMGGPSSEHEISLKTGREVLKNLDRNKYRPLPIAISKKGQWFLGGRRTRPEKALARIDVIFNAMHGQFGEDGRAQALFEFHGVPYTGSGVKASELGMDKAASRAIFRRQGLKTPKSVLFGKKEYRIDKKRIKAKIFKIHGGPWVIKPASCGSSLGVTLAKSEVALEKAINNAFRFAPKVLVEEYLRGREITVPVLEVKSGWPKALPVIEIRPKQGDFFDYREKYKKGGAEEIVPAGISAKARIRVRAAALAAHRVLGCRGYSRVDMILCGKTPYILELNTLPGLTSASLFPKAAKAAGIAFPKLLDILIANALQQ